MTVRSATGVDFEITVPFLIVGGGGAGLTAALAARDAGIAAVVLERDALPSGSTALSAGLIPAAGTRWQRAAGISDSADRFADDIIRKADGEPDPEAVRTVTRTIPTVLEWLADRHGFEFSVIEDFTYPGHSARRMHGLASRTGRELVDRLHAAAVSAGVEVMSACRVVALYAHSDGRIAGVGVLRPDGSEQAIGCTALLLACSGYGGNPALVRRLIPSLAEATYFGHPGNQGDALLWGEALGAATRHLGGHQGHGSVAHPHGILITYAAITEGGFQVNLAGRRFSDEAHGYSEQAANVIAQPQAIAFTIFDERIAGIARQFEDFRRAEASGAVHSAPDTASLAKALGLDPAALAASFAAVDDLKQRSGIDDFGRSFAGSPPLVPPFKAVRVTGALFHTQGGLVVDATARVVRPDGWPFVNLFAAGGAAVGVSGAGATGYLSGNGLLTALAYGYAAGSACSGGGRAAD